MAVTMIASPSRNRGALLALLLSCPSSPPLAGEPVISEFMADNTDTLRDADQDTSDWIEIHNPGPGPAQLGGWHLSDDAENLTRWTFPAGIEVAAGAYLLVFASGKDRGAPTEFFDARDSGDFAHALEFEDGRVPSAAGRADGWQERGLVPDATEPPSLAIRDGALLFDTLGALGENSIRLGPTLSAWNDEVGRETSYTVEVRVRVTEQGGDAPGFNLWGGSGKFEHSAFVSVELDRVIYGVATEPELARVLHSGDNSTEFVTQSAPLWRQLDRVRHPTLGSRRNDRPDVRLAKRHLDRCPPWSRHFKLPRLAAAHRPRSQHGVPGGARLRALGRHGRLRAARDQDPAGVAYGLQAFVGRRVPGAQQAGRVGRLGPAKCTQGWGSRSSLKCQANRAWTPPSGTSVMH